MDSVLNIEQHGHTAAAPSLLPLIGTVYREVISVGVAER